MLFFTGSLRRRCLHVALCSLSLVPATWAGYIYDFAPQANWQLVNTNGDGSILAQSADFVLTGPNNGSFAPGTTDYFAVAASGGVVTFNWSYSTCSPTDPPVCNDPTFTFAGYLLNGSYFGLADTNGQSGQGMFPVSPGDTFGFRVGSVDNTGEPGILTVTSTTPEPGTASILLFGLTILAVCWCLRMGHKPSHARVQGS